MTNDAVDKNNSHIHIINLVHGPAETVTQPRLCVFVGITTSNDDFCFARQFVLLPLFFFFKKVTSLRAAQSRPALCGDDDDDDDVCPAVCKMKLPLPI